MVGLRWVSRWVVETGVCICVTNISGMEAVSVTLMGIILSPYCIGSRVLIRGVRPVTLDAMLFGIRNKDFHRSAYVN